MTNAASGPRRKAAYGISTDVKRQDRFWIKSQPYSLADMLANDDSIDQFADGTVYQVFFERDQLPPLAQPGAGRSCERSSWRRPTTQRPTRKAPARSSP